MNVLLVGSGGREHALAWALRKSPRLERLYAAPGSAGMADLAEPVPADPLDSAALAQTCRERGVGLVVIGPEAPLALGVADGLRAQGLSVFGPGRDAARLESSKAHAKAFMARHALPTARHAVFTSFEEARAALPSFGASVVVKADGLAAGKGVRVCASRPEAEAALSDFLLEKLHGEAGRTVVLEERLEGTEATLMAILDGKSYRLLPSSQDHKRLREGDQGPNTGGMGAVSPAPALTPALLRRIRSEVFDRALAGLRADGLDFRGVLYAGLMLTREGPKLLEFNVRFGDPETQAVLPLLEDDLLDLLHAAAEGRLGEGSVRAYAGSSVCVVLASEGYPEKAKTGRDISGLGGSPGLVFHAGTKLDGAVWRTAGGRVLGVCASGPNLAEARGRAYEAAGRIAFEGMHYRRDIGAASPCAC